MSINLMNVKHYTVWFAGIKIAMIIGCIILGAGILFGIILFPHGSNYFRNFTEHGGCMALHPFLLLF
ncbi:hypothetical protein AB9M62_00050 [Bacillales bacterium AN1005]